MRFKVDQNLHAEVVSRLIPLFATRSLAGCLWIVDEIGVRIRQGALCEFLLGRYCASIDEDEIQEGLEIVERQLRYRAVRSGEEELFKARARETGTVKIIDIISARLDAKTDSYLATLPSLQLKDVSIDDALVRDNERMLTGGFYAEIDLSYDASIAQDKNGRPFSTTALRPIQLSKREVLESLYEGLRRQGDCGPDVRQHVQGVPAGSGIHNTTPLRAPSPERIARQAR